MKDNKDWKEAIRVDFETKKMQIMIPDAVVIYKVIIVKEGVVTGYVKGANDGALVFCLDIFNVYDVEEVRVEDGVIVVNLKDGIQFLMFYQE